MRLISILYQYTEYLRTSSDAYGDTEPAGTKVSQAVFGVVVPNEREYWQETALNYLHKNYSGYNRDPAFKIIDVSSTTVNVILHADTRLD